MLCVFANVSPTIILELTNAALGLEFTLDELMRCGERAWNLKRVINNRLGLTRADDKLPKALLEPYPDGGAAGFVPELDAMLSAYYVARGWDPISGYPSQEKLIDLGLEWTEPQIAINLQNRS